MRQGCTRCCPPRPPCPAARCWCDEVYGRPLRLPQDLPALVQALAALHALPLPAGPDRAPLL
jgi:hypothetical protein